MVISVEEIDRSLSTAEAQARRTLEKLGYPVEPTEAFSALNSKAMKLRSGSATPLDLRDHSRAHASMLVLVLCAEVRHFLRRPDTTQAAISAIGAALHVGAREDDALFDRWSGRKFRADQAGRALKAADTKSLLKNSC